MKSCVKTCPSPYYGLLDSGKCITDCPSTCFFKKEDSRICTPCHESCFTCDGDSGVDCLTCNPERFHEYGATKKGRCLEDCTTAPYIYKFLEDDVCLMECPREYT